VWELSCPLRSTQGVHGGPEIVAVPVLAALQIVPKLARVRGLGAAGSSRPDLALQSRTGRSGDTGRESASLQAILAIISGSPWEEWRRPRVRQLLRRGAIGPCTRGAVRLLADPGRPLAPAPRRSATRSNRAPLVREGSAFRLGGPALHGPPRPWSPLQRPRDRFRGGGSPPARAGAPPPFPAP